MGRGRGEACPVRGGRFSRWRACTVRVRPGARWSYVVFRAGGARHACGDPNPWHEGARRSSVSPSPTCMGATSRPGAAATRSRLSLGPSPSMATHGAGQPEVAVERVCAGVCVRLWAPACTARYHRSEGANPRQPERRFKRIQLECEGKLLLVDAHVFIDVHGQRSDAAAGGRDRGREDVRDSLRASHQDSFYGEAERDMAGLLDKVACRGWPLAATVTTAAVNASL